MEGTMFDDWKPSDPVAELGGSVLPEVVSEDGSNSLDNLDHATVVSRMSAGNAESDGMPRRVELKRKWAKHGIEARRVYVQLTDAETDALTMLWRLVYPKPGEEREPFATPDDGEWEYPAQVYRHLKGLLEEYAAITEAVRDACRIMDPSPENLVAAILNIVGTDDREALRAIRDKLTCGGKRASVKAREQ